MYVAAFDRAETSWPQPLIDGIGTIIGAASAPAADPWAAAANLPASAPASTPSVDPWAAAANLPVSAPVTAPAVSAPAPTPAADTWAATSVPAAPVAAPVTTPATAPAAGKMSGWAVAGLVAAGGVVLAMGLASVLGPRPRGARFRVPRLRAPLPARFAPRLR